MERAWKMTKDGADRREVVAIVEPLAYVGDSRAQLLLGAIYFDGKDVPRDVVQGYAWLEVAATAADVSIAEQAQAMLRNNEPALSGSDLIRADQRAATIRSTVSERLYERYSHGLRHFTPQRPLGYSPWIAFGTEVVQLSPGNMSEKNPDFKPGCAAVDDRLCTPQSRSVEGPRCTGRIVQADAGPSAIPDDETYLVDPYYPVELRRTGVSGAAMIIAHVDRSGWICGAAIAESSGEPLIDKEALAAVVLWRLKPATRRGEAVEALHLTRLSFNLQDN